MPKEFKAKVLYKHETEAHWLLSSYIPENTELVVYDEDETHDYKRFKFGDGVNYVYNLPFANKSEGSSSVVVSEAAPENPTTGMMWIDTSLGYYSVVLINTTYYADAVTDNGFWLVTDRGERFNSKDLYEGQIITANEKITIENPNNGNYFEFRYCFEGNKCTSWFYDTFDIPITEDMCRLHLESH